jgi:hypothetical protein
MTSWLEGNDTFLLDVAGESNYRGAFRSFWGGRVVSTNSE